jgi:hypothetical protein
MRRRHLSFKEFIMPTFKISDIDPINQRNLKALENGGNIEFWQKAKVVAIGSGHKPEVMAAVKLGGARGTITITKGSLTNPGTLEVHGHVDRLEFSDAMKRISKKKVIYK